MKIYRFTDRRFCETCDSWTLHHCTEAEDGTQKTQECEVCKCKS